jgi:nucleoside-diphosphate-sugar epimerase
MSILILGATGFIGRRLVPLLVKRGEEIVCMDINPGTANYGQFGKQVRVVRGDVTQFDDVVAVTAMAKPSRVVNLAYFLGSEHAPHVATKLNIIGMDNCFEAARLCGVNRAVFASSLAVSGEQSHYGERVVDEDDFRHGHVQYAMHKIFNEWQAQDYREKYGMEITAIRPANVTGPDKIVGSVDHVKCITFPARGEAISFPHKDAMRCPIHVDDIAEVFARVLLTDKPRHAVYNSGGTPISLGELADLVHEFLPDARITFDHETGGKATSGNYLIENSRLIQEFGLQYLPYRQRVLQIINDTRRDAGLPLVSDR